MKTETIDGKALAVMESVVNGMVVATEHLASTSKGVYRHRANGVEVDPPLCIIKYPFKEDEEWKASPKIGPQQLRDVAQERQKR